MTANNKDNKQEHPLDEVFLNMSAFVAHQLIRAGISASISHDTSKLRQVSLNRTPQVKDLNDSEVVSILEKNGTDLSDFNM